mmetsp:Transcript_79135/g.255865  ORF Transcript_79135/g.255865 Transcript_79135/m.255865 type:complete len:280 (-) Transcript_79135:901-1740(-)
MAVHRAGEVRTDDSREVRLLGVELRVEVPGLDEAREARLHLDLSVLAQLDVGDVVVVPDGRDASNHHGLPDESADIRGVAVLHVPPNGVVLDPLEHADRVELPRVCRIGHRRAAGEDVKPIRDREVVGTFRAVYAGLQGGAQLREAPRRIRIEELSLLIAAVCCKGVLEGQLVQDALTPETDIQEGHACRWPLGHREVPWAPSDAAIGLDWTTRGILRRHTLRHVPGARLSEEGADPDVAMLVGLHELSGRLEGTLSAEPDGCHSPLRWIRTRGVQLNV